MEMIFLTNRQWSKMWFKFNMEILNFLQIGKGHVTERDVYTEFHRYTWCSMGTFNTELEQGWTN